MLIEPGLAILLSASGAVLTWWFTHRAQLAMSRRNHTYDVFQRYKESTDFLKDFERVCNLTDRDEIPKPNDVSRADDIQAIDNILDHFEFIAVAVLSGDIDEGFMKQCEYTRISLLYQDLFEYIKETQDWLDQPTYCENISELLDRWNDDYPTNRHALYEYFFLRPYRMSRPRPDDKAVEVQRGQRT